jgi:uncharacterized protein (TIGR00369 family)
MYFTKQVRHLFDDSHRDRRGIPSGVSGGREVATFRATRLRESGSRELRKARSHTLSASLESVTPGLVEIALTPGSAVSQQHGFVHAGALAAIADSAAGYAALSLMPPGAGVLTTEFKINLLAPAAGGAHSRERACHQGWSDTGLGSDEGVLPDCGRGEACCPPHRDADDRRGARRRQ